MRVSSRHGECLRRALRRTGRIAISLLPCIIGLMSVSQAAAAILTVGAPGSGCDHASVQAAVNAAGSAVGTDEIRIARSAAWTAQQITVDTDEEIHLIGGYADCTSTTPDGTKTVLSGAGGDARPVLTIRGNGFVYLRGLTIRDGDQAGDDNGGGINFAGGGILDITDSFITDNTANDGGGIYATGTTITAEVVLGADVTVSSNIARNSGGGMVSKSLETSIIGPGTAFLFNQALGQGGGGYGGGLVVVSDQLPSYAYIRSNGIGGLGVIYGNEAVHGGGVAVLVGGGTEQEAQARIYSTDPQQPVRIQGNQASVDGGGVYVREIDVGVAIASAYLWRAAINDNKAPDGAALYAEGTGWVNFEPISGAASAPLGTPQNEIIGNLTGNTTGAILRMARGFPDLDRLEIRGNDGGRLLYATDTPQSTITNSLIADNNVAQELIRSADEDGYTLSMSHVTIAGNAIGAPHVIFVDHVFTFDRSLVAQPGKVTLADSPGTRNIGYVLTNDPSNMIGGASLLVDPRFVDPANGDYHLRAGSYAVDFAPAAEGPDVNLNDLEGRAHTLDMPNGGFADRTADVGAYERPALQPLVYNADFDVDRNLWGEAGEGAIPSWDGTQNQVGLDGSGSLKVDADAGGGDGINAPNQAGPGQCIHLPAPGVYLLNGWARALPLSSPLNPVPGNAFLKWELRYDGGAPGCLNGVPDQSGTHVLATGTSNWVRPGSPAVIEIPPGTWRSNTSLIVKPGASGLAAGDGTGWFDGITLDLLQDDSIFRDGFEAAP